MAKAPLTQVQHQTMELPTAEIRQAVNDLPDHHRLSIQRKSTLAVTLIGTVALAPFVISNLLIGRYPLALGTLIVTCLFAINAWLLRKGTYSPTVTLYSTAPAILLLLGISIHTQGISGALWSYPALITFYFMLDERKAWIANIILMMITFPLSWLYIEHGQATRVIVTVIAVSIFSAVFIRIINEQQSRLQAQLVTDPLTGLLNRNLLDDTLNHILEQSNRNNLPMTLLSIDLDHFKIINDQFGHIGGDEVLEGLGKLLRHNTRGADRVFRLGGEEFMVILYGANSEDGLHVAENLRQTIEKHPFLPDKTVTASFGIATLVAGETPKEWVRRSDVNLYRAKLAGRNRVISDVPDLQQ